MVTVVMIPMLEVSNQAPESKATFVHLFIYEFDKTVSWGKECMPGPVPCDKGCG